MKKIDELILKVIQLKPQMYHIHGDDKYTLFYKNITFYFWNMNLSNKIEKRYNIGLVRINHSNSQYYEGYDITHNISHKTVSAVMEYFNKYYDIDDLLNIVNKDIRKEKLLSINKIIG